MSNSKFTKAFKDMIEKKANELAEKLLDEAKMEINDIVSKSAKKTTIDLYEEAVNMYDSLIEQYYRYKTTSYYRHNAGVGTCWGDNLYYGKNFYIDAEENLNIEFSGEKMERYISKYKIKKGDTSNSLDKKERVSRDTVLSIVRGGFRGVPGKWIIPWSGSYDGEYFQISDTNIDKAFGLFEKNYDDLYGFAMRSNVKQTIKKNKYKYFK